MAIRNIRRQATVPGVATSTAAPIYVDSDDNKLKMIPAGSGTTEVEVVDASSTQTLTNKTLTAPVINDAILAKTAVVSLITTAALTAALHAGKTVVLNLATGFVTTLPAATGTGNSYLIYVGISASGGSYVIQVASGTDIMRGIVVSKDDGTSSSVISWATANTGTTATESDTVTLDGSTKGGLIGDCFEFTDIAAGVWAVQGFTKSSGTEATPFSAAV